MLRRTVTTFAALAVSASLAATPALAGSETQPPRSDWLATVNAYRSTADLPPVVEDRALSDGDAKHARYMAINNAIGHYEQKDKPGYTPEGAKAGQQSNVAGIWDEMDARGFIDMWMTGPFHAAGILDPQLKEVGYGQHTSGEGVTAAALDVLGGLDRSASFDTVVWPADGATVPVGTYDGGEWPDPLAGCAGYHEPTGLPLVVQFGDVDPRVTGHTFTSGGEALEHCVYDPSSYTHSDERTQAYARRLMATRGTVIIVPRAPLTRGTSYTLTLDTTAGKVRTTFTFGDRFRAAGTGRRDRGPAPRPEPEPEVDVPSPYANLCREGQLGRGRFADVPRWQPHGPGVDCVAELGITAGRADGTFGPADTVTRAQMASFLARTIEAAGGTLPQPSGRFTDVSGTHADAIERLAAAGIVSGVAAHRYAPERAVTRAQMATFLDRTYTYVAEQQLPAAGDTFADDDGSAHEPAIDRIAAAGLASGTGAGRYSPGAAVNRGQMATFLARTVDLLTAGRGR